MLWTILSASNIIRSWRRHIQLCATFEVTTAVWLHIPAAWGVTLLPGQVNTDVLKGSSSLYLQVQATGLLSADGAIVILRNVGSYLPCVTAWRHRIFACSNPVYLTFCFKTWWQSAVPELTVKNVTFVSCDCKHRQPYLPSRNARNSGTILWTEKKTIREHEISGYRGGYMKQAYRGEVMGYWLFRNDIRGARLAV